MGRGCKKIEVKRVLKGELISFKLNKVELELAKRMFKDLLTNVVQRLFDHVNIN